jgi:hypothetical protein
VPDVSPAHPQGSNGAQIAQLVEQRIENPRVAGSIPALGTTNKLKIKKENLYYQGVSVPCLTLFPSGLTTFDARTALASGPSRKVKVCKFFPARTPSREYQRGIDSVF